MSGNILGSFDYLAYQGMIEKDLSSQNQTATLNISSSTNTLEITSNKSSSSVSIKLSPEAQDAIEKQKIALDLISPSVSQEKTSPQSSNQSQQQSESASTSNTSPNPTVSDSENPSVEDILRAGQNAIADNPAAVFNSFVNQSGGAAQYISGYGDAGLQSSFIAAFNSGALNVQDASKVSALDFTQSVTFSGSGGSSTSGWSSIVQAQLDAQNGTYSVGQILSGFGGLYVTWANPSAA